MIYVNYYSRMRNTLDGNAEQMRAAEKDKIVTKIVERSNIALARRMVLDVIATQFAIDAAFFNQDLPSHYRTFQIPKKTGGYRTLTAPDDVLKAYQKRVQNYLVKSCSILPHNAAHAYVKHRNCKTAIQTHQQAGARWFLKLDIKDFFDSCSEYALKRTLTQIHPLCTIPFMYIEPIIKACTLHHHLPQGAPTSPVLSNLYMLEFDYNLTEHLGPGYTYTRYADDILISCPYKFDYVTIVRHVQAMLPPGMNIKPSKTRFGSCNGSNWNLGIMYNKEQQLTVGYKAKHLMKNKIHNLFTNVPPEHTPEFDVWLEEVYRLKGTLGYYKYIEPEYFTNLIQNYRNKGYNV